MLWAGLGLLPPFFLKGSSSRGRDCIRRRALTMDSRTRETFNHANPSIHNKRFLISTRRASLLCISLRIYLSQSNSRRVYLSFCLDWFAIEPSNCGPYFVELTKHLLSKRAELLTEVFCCVSCSLVMSLTAHYSSPLLYFDLKGAYSLFYALLEVVNILEQSSQQLLKDSVFWSGSSQQCNPPLSQWPISSNCIGHRETFASLTHSFPSVI